MTGKRLVIPDDVMSATKVGTDRNVRLLQYTNVTTTEISDLAKMKSFVIGKEVAGPADITVIGDKMYVPDLPNSRVICVSVGN